MKKKRLLSLVMSAALLFGSAAALPEGVFETSTSITVNAENEDNFTYSVLDNGTVVITGYTGGGIVNIPTTLGGKTVSGFGTTFKGNTNITRVNIPDSVTSIAANAFNGCTNISGVTIGSGVTSIGANAFNNCSSLTSIDIPDSVITIGEYAFAKCSSMRFVTFGSGLRTIGDYAFYSCESLSSINFPNSLNIIGNYAFYNCYSITSLTIPGSVHSIGSYSFARYPNNYIPGDKHSSPPKGWYKWSYTGWKNQEYVYDDITYYSTMELRSIVLEEGIESIGAYAFLNCRYIDSIRLPNSLVSVGDYSIGARQNDKKYKAYYSVCEIRCYKDSVAQAYAKNNSFSFKLLDVTKVGAKTPTCTQDGNIEYYTYGTQFYKDALATQELMKSETIVPATGHNWANSYVITPATCENDGLMGWTCSNCDASKTEPIIKFGHEYSERIVAPTCTEKGYTLHECKRCSNSYTDTYTSALGHNWSGWQTTTNPTCESDGVDTKTCSRCGKTETKAVEKLGHNYIEKVIAPTCTSKGYTLHTCTRCGYFYQDKYTDITPHTWGNWKVTKDPTCTAEGTKTRICSGCQKTDSVSVAKLGHNYNTKVIEPTCISKGYTLHTCSRCDDSYKTDYKDAIGHKWKTVTYTWSSNNAKCTANIVCANDSSHSQSETVNSSYKVTTPATYTSTGVGTYTAIFTNTAFSKQTKTVTIPKLSLINISSATINGVNSSYTYTGKEITPTVTVKLNSKTLTNGTDYSVAYKNNTNVGTATITVTGKGNYTGSVSKTFTIVAGTTPSSSFVWGKDNWNYNNSSYSGYFSSGTYRSQINNTYQNKLKSNLTNSEYQVIFVGSWYSDAWLDDIWGGSCYGMSSTTFLAQKGLLPYSSYGSGATKLHDLTWPTKSSNISSLVTYYQMLQVKDVIQQQYRTIPSKSNSTNINNIINLLKANPTVLIGFQKSGWGGHAILAYGYEYGSWTYNGVTYQGRIKICDPNSSIKNDESYYIYYNTSTYSWAIPAYYGITSAKGATFNYIGANVNEINQGGYLSGNSSTRSSDYIARIDAAAISNNRSVAKVKNTNGNYVNQNTAPGDIVESYSYVVGGNEKETVGYDLYDADAAYMVSQAEAVNLQLSIKYQDCRLSGGSAAGDSIIFDKKGYVSVKGESAQFNISMTHDIDFPTDWFTVQVKGDNVNDASLEMVNNGWIISADQLENVVVAVNNKDDSAKTKFSTEYKSALIYEINKNTIGIAVDTDNNGTYETKVKTEDLTQTRLAGKGRFETAVEISKAGFPDGSKTVVLAYGLNYADALAGVSLAKAMNAPILLTNLKALPKETLEEIQRLGATDVIILGGTGAVGAEVETALKKEGLKTERIAGGTRFETATKIAEKMQALSEDKAPEDIFFVYAFNSADALSVSAVAAVKGAPVIYLKTKGELDNATAAYLDSVKGKVKNAYVIGGTGVISDEMMKKAGDAVGVKATRVFGKDRFETCVAVNDKFKDVLNGDSICVATGMDFPDALAGGVFAALNKAPLFLVNGKLKTLTLSNTQKAYLKTKAPQKLYVFGGTGAVPDSHVQTVAKASV